MDLSASGRKRIGVYLDKGLAGVNMSITSPGSWLA